MTQELRQETLTTFANEVIDLAFTPAYKLSPNEFMSSLIRLGALTMLDQSPATRTLESMQCMFADAIGEALREIRPESKNETADHDEQSLKEQQLDRLIDLILSAGQAVMSKPDEVFLSALNTCLVSACVILYSADTNDELLDRIAAASKQTLSEISR